MKTWPKNYPRVPMSFVGTGDIEAPKAPTEYTIDPDGERERLRVVSNFVNESFEKLTERARTSSAKKIGWLVEAAANAKLSTKAQIRDAAIRLGCEEREIRRQMMSPSFRRILTDKVQTLAVHYTAAALPYQAELAKTDKGSFDSIAKIGKVLESAGINVQQNTLIDRRNGGDDEGDANWFKNFQERSQRNLKLIGGKVDPNDPIEPETTIVGEDPEPGEDEEPPEPDAI